MRSRSRISYLAGGGLLLVAVVLAAVLVAGGNGGPGEPESFSYSVSGGVAGIDRRLEVAGERVTLAERGAEPVEVAVEPALLAGARSALREAPLEEIAAAPPEGAPIPDDVTYGLSVGGLDLTASQARGPDPRLQPVIDALDPLLVAAVDRVNPTRR